MTITASIRKDMKKLAKRYLGGESFQSIANDYGCSYKLVERTMKQELPAELFAERKRNEILQEKKKLSGETERGHGVPRKAVAA